MQVVLKLYEEDSSSKVNFLDNCNRDKISESFTKKPIFGTEWDSLRGKKMLETKSSYPNFGT